MGNTMDRIAIYWRKAVVRKIGNGVGKNLKRQILLCCLLKEFAMGDNTGELHFLCALRERAGSTMDMITFN